MLLASDERKTCTGLPTLPRRAEGSAARVPSALWPLPPRPSRGQEDFASGFWKEEGARGQGCEGSSENRK